MILKRLIIVLLVSVSIFGCKKKEADTKEANATINTIDVVYGDALSTGEIGEPINLIPAIASDSASHGVASYIYNGLVKYNKDLNLIGDLAKSWSITNDNKTITFVLRDDVKWHDGQPFTAADVKFTYEFMIADDTPTSYDGDFRKVKDFEIIDNYTVRISYDEPYSPALNGWGIWIMPAHLLKGVQASKSPLQRKPVGTGPYILEEWNSGKSITLKANPDYFLGRPKVDKVMVRVIPDQATQFLELLNGSIDIMSLTPIQAAKQTENQRYSDSYETYSHLDNSYTYVGYNLQKAPFNDKRVRQALSYGTPKDEIIEGILFGKGVAATGPYKPGGFWHSENVKKFDYDIEKAKNLLAEAGYKDTNGDGILEKDGKKLRFEMITNQGNSSRSQVAEILQRSWKEIGVQVDIRILEWATFLNEYINKGNFDAIVMGWNIIQDPDIFDVWSSTKCGGNGLNFICFKNDEVDRLLEAGQASYNPKIRKKAYDKLQEILAEEQPYTFLYVPYANTALNKRFKNVKPELAGIDYNFIDWYVPLAEQKYHFTEK